MKHEAEETNDALLARLQREAFGFFQFEGKPLRAGLFPDSTRPDSPVSIASVGAALSAFAVASERGLVERAEAVRTILASLRFFRDSEQNGGHDATGYRGFYYHFLDRQTGRRTGGCELSSIDTTLFIAGALMAARYFDGDDADERAIRETADALYRRIEWDWMQDGDGGGAATIRMGWKPETGFLPPRWTGFSEGLLLYIFALGSPTYPADPRGYEQALSEYSWRRLYGQEFVYAGPLFIHQMPHCYIDFKGIRDTFMRAHDSDYFENSRRATVVQREYAIRNPRGFARYGADFWGVTASDGPGPATRRIGDKDVTFFDYKARGVPWGPDDGTVAPWAVVASLPFAPDIVLSAIRAFLQMRIGETSAYGFEASVNPTFPGGDDRGRGWVSPYNYGLNQGPIVLMIENYRSGLPWRLMRACPYIVAGLRRAGFTGGWLDEANENKEKDG